MDGMRKHAQSLSNKPKFNISSHNRFAVIHASAANKVFSLKPSILSEGDLCSFFSCSDDSRVYEESSVLKLVCIPADRVGSCYISKSTFRDLLKAIGVDPWVEHLIYTTAFGCHHSGCTTSETAATFYLGTTFAWILWTTHYEKSRAVTKCLVLKPWRHKLTDGDSLHDPLSGLMKDLKTFGNDFHTPLYFPFILTFNALRYREQKLLQCLNIIRDVELKTGHGSWGYARYKEDRDSIFRYTARLGAALNTIGSTLRHLNIIESVWQHLETLNDEISDLEKGERMRTSDKSVLCATGLLRHQSLIAREQAQYLELRIRSQSSILFAFLTHEDAQINIQLANTSRDLAETTRRDGSSMKTIAILTMAFLPATFLATLFALPSLQWDQPDKFAIYWAFVIPVTIVTFTLWLTITQRRLIAQAITSLRKRCIRGDEM